MFRCPGCRSGHVIPTGQGVGPRWSWNGDAHRPTFKPSILVRRPDPDGELPEDVCHSFVRDGQIQFLNDCTHALAGQTVPLPEWTA
jgi:hypothetical protein